MARLALASTAALLLAGVACDSGDPCRPGDEPTLEIGNGDRGWTAAAPDSEQPLIHGPQGGVHLVIGLKATQLDAVDLATAELTGSIGGQLLAQSAPWLQFECTGDGSAQLATDINLIYDADPADLDGQTTDITAVVTDLSGGVAEASTRFVIRDTM